MRVVFRADGNSTIGLGHLVRSLALAEILAADFELLFLTQTPDPAVQELFQAASIPWQPLPSTTNYEEEATYITNSFVREYDIVVLDGYFFNTSYQNIFKKALIKLVCLDDIHAFPFAADVIINQAGGITPALYEALPETKFCLGPSYALLRKDFLQAARKDRPISEIRRIFLNMGGADPGNDTLKVVAFLQQYVSQLQIEIVIGSAYRHLPELLAVVAANPHINLHQDLKAAAMCQFMQTCDAAILPPSSVAYEWCSVSGPLFLHQTAANQVGMANFLLTQELATTLVTLPTFITASQQNDFINQQIAQQRKFFNGESGKNLRSVFLELAFQDTFKLRRAYDSDMLLLFNWINDPVVRSNSFQSAPIPLASHANWYQSKINNPDCLLLIGEVQAQPAGMLRYDVAINQKRGTISYLVAPEFRGKGLGTQILLSGESWFKTVFPEINLIIGQVQPENLASVKSFRKAGYSPSGTIIAEPPNAIVFEKRLF